MSSSPHAGGSGVGVLGPNVLYCWSIAARMARSGLPSACMVITSRVMLRQMSQVAPWLVKVMWPPDSRSAT
jgi:hypothetical protein